MDYKIIRLIDAPYMKNKMAAWFHEKWGISLEAYENSMNTCLSVEEAVPAWYAVIEGERIIGGAGVIENDFHDRPDLAPNVCALYVEPDRRGRGIAGELLRYIANDMQSGGIDKLYLVTDHTAFYERYGWKYLCDVKCDGEDFASRMYVHY